jgi:hypothetical protein
MTYMLTPSRPGAIRAGPLGWQVGAQISTLAGLREGAGPSGLGRVGCFGLRRDARQWADPLLLTNQHVLAAHGAEVGDPVFVPEVTPGESTLELDPDSLAQVAVVGDGYDGVHRFAFPGEPEQAFHVDCAVARLTDEGAMPEGEVAFRVGRVHPHDALSHRSLPVRLLGVHAVTAGHVIDVDATVERADGTKCPGTIVIRTRADRPPFAAEGDSGALVVDRHDRAVGLLWGVHLTDPTLAFACHLLPAVDRLGVVPSLRSALATLAEDS